MASSSHPTSSANQALRQLPVISRQSVKTCHIRLPNEPKPISGLAYGARLFSFVRLYPSLEEAIRGADRLIAKGNYPLLIEVPKGIALVVFEPDAQLA